MNLKELSQLDVKDLKNIDYKAALNSLKKRPEILVNSIAILAALVFCFTYYNSKKTELSELAITATTLESKYKIFDEYQKANALLKELKSAFPPQISEAGLIELTAKQAEKYNVNIGSFSPAKITNHKAYETITLTIDISARSYENLWNFIYSMERNFKTLRFDTWRANPGNSRSTRSAAPAHETITTNLTLTVVNFKND